MPLTTKRKEARRIHKIILLPALELRRATPIIEPARIPKANQRILCSYHNRIRQLTVEAVPVLFDVFAGAVADEFAVVAEGVESYFV